MTSPKEWSLLTVYSSGYEADFAVALLRANEIPVLRRGPEVGIFGPGFSGATVRGVEIHVPADSLEEARAILALDTE